MEGTAPTPEIGFSTENCASCKGQGKPGGAVVLASRKWQSLVSRLRRLLGQHRLGQVAHQ